MTEILKFDETKDTTKDGRIISVYRFEYDQKLLHELIEEGRVPPGFTGTIEIKTKKQEFDLVRIVNGLIGSDDGPAIEIPRYNQRVYFIKGKKTTQKAWKETKKLKGTTIGFPVVLDPNFSMTAEQENAYGVLVSMGPLKWKLDIQKLYWVVNETTKEFWGLEKSELLSRRETTVFNSQSEKYFKDDSYTKTLLTDLNLVLLDQLSQVKNQSQGKP